MIDASTYWFSPAPSEVSLSRLSLDFDLRAADLFFRELLVPELGRIWFTRQLSWPLAALSLHEELASRSSDNLKPTAICHGIEALACKLECRVDQQDPSPRILGRRAFGRDSEDAVWSFRRLRQPTNYVRNTHRQATTRALRADGGLGFARGSRFDLLELEPIGRALANVFLEQPVGRGGTTLRKWLLGWLQGKGEMSGRSTTLRQALSPECPTKEERSLVRARLIGTSTPASETRNRLARALGSAAEFPDIEGVVVVRLREAGHREQASQVLAARSFGAVLDRTRDAVAQLTRKVEAGRGGEKLAALASDSTIRRAIKSLRAAANTYIEKSNTADVREPTSRSFADTVVASDDRETIRLIVLRAGEVFALADGLVLRGPLFRVIDATDEMLDIEDAARSIEPDLTGRTFRIANLHSLLRDVDLRGAR